MSSEGTQPDSTKKRRLRGACDICRRQKIRCDRAQMPGNRCSNCVSFNSECTHNFSQFRSNVPQEKKAPRRKRTVPKTAMEETTTSDSSRLFETAKNVVDGLLRQEPTYQVPEDYEALLQLLLDVARYARSLEDELSTYRSQSPPSGRTGSISASPTAEDPDEKGSGIVVDLQKLPEHLRRITTDASNHRFFGKNSYIMFVKAAIEGKRKKESINIFTPWSRRPEFWTPQPWEAYPEPPVAHIFPPDDLLWDLVDIYFTQLNYSFILHRPSFEKGISDGLHLRDHRFGAVVLAVSALASKNSPDERVLLPGMQGEISAGWKWFRQIRRPFSGPIVEAASLYELQLCYLYIMFQQTGSDLEACWLMSGIGILHAQDIGAHRRPNHNGPLDLRDELLKRCFHSLFMFDGLCSACFGRPPVIKATECDLDLPVACDDEYWEHPDPEKPVKASMVDFSAAYIKLVNIFTMSWRTAESPQYYVGQKPLEAEIIAELDNRLNKWAEEIPEHLLWNPYMENDTIFDQSASLYASYYHVQILVHRPFIVKQRSSQLKSLAICTNAARSCSHVIDVKSRRGFLPTPYLLKAAFDAAFVLLVNISGGARSGLSIDTDRELVDVYKCMKLIQQTERRWQSAGRFYDILCEVLNGSNLPLPPVLSLEDQVQLIKSSPTSKTTAEVRTATQRAQNPESWPGHSVSLPMAAEDLSRLPIYGSLDSSEMDILFPDLTATNIDVSEIDSLAVNLGVPDYNVSDTSERNNNLNLDLYLSHWLPYYSSVDEMAQMIQNASKN